MVAADVLVSPLWLEPRASKYLVDGSGYPFPLALDEAVPTLAYAESSGDDSRDGTGTGSSTSSFSDAGEAPPESPYGVQGDWKRHAGSTPFNFCSLPFLRSAKMTATAPKLVPAHPKADVAADKASVAAPPPSRGGQIEEACHAQGDIVYCSLAVSKRGERRGWGKGHPFLDGMHVANEAMRARTVADGENKRHR